MPPLQKVPPGASASIAPSRYTTEHEKGPLDFVATTRQFYSGS